MFNKAAKTVVVEEGQDGQVKVGLTVVIIYVLILSSARRCLVT